jgi:phosphatidylserine decarboxylase
MIPLSEFLAKIVVWIARTPFPRPIQCWINRWYVNWFDIDMEQFETEDPCKYPTLNDLFIRYKKVIEFYEDEEIVISPADAKVIADGEIEKGMALQVKKIPYKVSQLVGKRSIWTEGFLSTSTSPPGIITGSTLPSIWKCSKPDIFPEN